MRLNKKPDTFNNYSVRWESIYGDDSGQKEECEFFNKKKDANTFADSLKEVFLLISSNYYDKVIVKKEN